MGKEKKIKKIKKILFCCSFTLVHLVKTAPASRGVTALHPHSVLHFPAISNNQNETESNRVSGHPGNSNAPQHPTYSPANSGQAHV